MASLHCTVQPTQAILRSNHTFIRQKLKVPNFSSNQDPFLASLQFNSSPQRLKIGVRFQESPKLGKNVVFASRKSPAEGSDVEGTTKGPPLLTILAGLLVFAAVYWVFGSIVMWLIGLAANLFFK